MKKLHTYTIFLLLMLVTLNLKAQDQPAYLIYNAEGEISGYADMLQAATDVDMVFFGELHNDPIAHWLQMELTQDLFQAKGRDLILAAEMFEADNQLIMDEYLSGTISTGRFEGECRLWNNYKTDYKPLVEFAKKNELLFVASNIPRRYASLTSSGGFEALDALDEKAKAFIAPLPPPYDPELKCYKDMLNMGGMPGKKANENFPRAQAIKDATMAWFSTQAMQENSVLLHFNGSYHSDHHQGIVWYVEQYRPGTSVVTISTVLQDEVTSLQEEYLGKADFIIVVPASMTRTY